MKKLFAPYGLALLAKEKGFNEPCFTYYTSDSVLISGVVSQNLNNFNTDTFTVSAPLYQQLVDWFREEHEIVIDVFQEYDGDNVYSGFWEVDISELKKYKQPHALVIEEVFVDYYEALNKALTEAFKLT